MTNKEVVVRRTRAGLRGYIGLIACLLCISGCGDWRPIEEYEPLPASAKYKGRSLGEWVELLDSTEQSVRLEAVKAMEKYGPNAARALHRLVELLDEPEPMPGLAARALRRIGPEAKPAVPRLLALIEERPDLRASAVAALGEIGPGAAEAVPVLCTFPGNPDETYVAQRRATWALGSIRSLPEKSVPCLASVAEGNPFWELRVLALEALGRFGAEAMTAIPVIERASRDDDRRVRPAALAAKEKIEGSKSLQEWVQLLDSTNDWQRKCAFAALQYWGARSAPAVLKLTRLAERPSRWQVDAIRTLGAVGREAAQAVPGLISALSTLDNEVRAAAAEALGRIGTPGESGEVVEALEEAAADEAPEVRRGAKRALERLSPGGGS